MKNTRFAKWLKEHENDKTWIVILFTKPKLYLYNLLKRTMMVGIFLFLLCEALKYLEMAQTQSIPSTLHSLVGIVIGLLLVFRTNTAYDRWWEARKIFASLHATLIYIRVKFINSDDAQEAISQLKNLNDNIFKYVSADEGHDSIKIKEDFMKSYIELSALILNRNLPPPIHGNLEKKLAEIIESFASLERIKDTPIPMSYSFHIKLSIFLYLLSLPFGMLFDLGLWSIPCVMVLFFVVAGIEIISNEIENPFKDDPNDLPINNYKKENEKYING